MLKISLKVLAGVAAFALANPASAAVYNYTMTNGDLLSIDSTAQSATFTGATINASMTSSDFASFVGGALPTFTAVLSSLDGTRLVGGAWLTDNPLNSTTTHPQKLIISGANVNLWAWWGDPIKGGDYLTKINSYSTPNPVPEPGMLGIMAAGLAALGLTRRRRRANAR